MSEDDLDPAFRLAFDEHIAPLGLTLLSWHLWRLQSALEMFHSGKADGWDPAVDPLLMYGRADDPELRLQLAAVEHASRALIEKLQADPNVFGWLLSNAFSSGIPIWPETPTLAEVEAIAIKARMALDAGQQAKKSRGQPKRKDTFLLALSLRLIFDRAEQNPEKPVSFKRFVIACCETLPAESKARFKVASALKLLQLAKRGKYSLPKRR